MMEDGEVRLDSDNLLRKTLMFVLFLIGLLLIVVAFSIGSRNLIIQYIVLSIGASVLGSTFVIFVQRLTPLAHPEFRIITGHREIYDENEKMMQRLISPRRSHTIRTIYSYRPQSEGEDEWDGKVREYLQDPDHRYIRAIICRNDLRMEERITDIEEKYKNVLNHEMYVFEGQPTFEVFLIDDKEVLLSFATTKLEYPYITTAIWSRNQKLCKQLRDFHDRHCQIVECQRTPVKKKVES